MNKITALTIEHIIRTFLDNQPVNRIIRIAFHRGEKQQDCAELFKANVSFRYLEKADTVCDLRVHKSRLLSYVQDDLYKDEYGTEHFQMIYKGEEIIVAVNYDNSGWYTITSPKLDQIALLAIERAKE